MVYTAQLFGVPTKRIMDPVHGSIPIYSHEQAVIDTPLFQRLRHVLQNDVLFLVFPGAKHNRLLHSIGTMHMASTLFIQITSLYIANDRIKTIKDEQRRSVQYIHCCLRLAALLHDVGHFPFSHQFEECDAVEPLLSPSLLKDLWGNITSDEWKKIYDIDYRKKKISHEDFSVRIAYELFSNENILSGIDLETRDILYFLEAAKNDPSEILLGHCQNIITILFPDAPKNSFSVDVIKSFLRYLKSFISGELDADKMDYILRDSYFSGCRYGMYNKDHLINSLKVGYELFKDKSGQLFDVEFSLAILEKGIGALEDFVYARYQLYLELYNHKTVSGFRKLLSFAIGEVLSEQHNREEVKSVLLDLQKFSHFTDTFFWEKFRQYAKEHPSSACDRLINRKKLKYVMRKDDEDEIDIDLFCDRYYQQNGVLVGYWKSRVKFSQISPKFKSIKVLTKEKDPHGKVIRNINRKAVPKNHMIVSFNKKYSHPGGFWRKQPFHIKKMLQKFEFPKGIVFDGETFRTPEICSIFKLNDFFLANKFCNVDYPVPSYEHEYSTNFSVLSDKEILAQLKTITPALTELDNIINTPKEEAEQNGFFVRDLFLRETG